MQDAVLFFRQRALVARHQNEGIRLGQEALGSLRILGNRRPQPRAVYKEKPTPQDLDRQLNLGICNIFDIARVRLLGHIVRQLR